MNNCLRKGKPFRYITNVKVNSAFHPSGCAFTCIGWQTVTLCDAVWQVKLRKSAMGFA